MINYMQTIMVTFVEALCCKIFLDTFLEKKYPFSRWKNRIGFAILFIGFIGISFLNMESYALKAVISIMLIYTVTFVQYEGNRIQNIFPAIGYYGLLISVDRIMLILIQNIFMQQAENMFDDPIKTTILALLCKTVIFLCIVFLNRKFKVYDGFNLIPDSEWIRFLFFPLITIICMSAFAIEGRPADHAMLIASFGLVFMNFFVFYMIRDVVVREKEVQKIRISQERTKNQMDMYRYMETVYGQQRKKVHEFKNHMGCLQGLLEAEKYEKAVDYLKRINENWTEEIDYINTNNIIVNSVLNQKFKLAQNKGIPIVLSVSSLKEIPIEDEDLVTLLANLLDNAIEACEKVADKTKVIKLRFVDENGKITISVKNPTAEGIRQTGNRILTTKRNKEEHGIGLENIRNVVEKYGGDDIFSCNGGYFTHSIIIQY